MNMRINVTSALILLSALAAHAEVYHYSYDVSGNLTTVTVDGGVPVAPTAASAQATNATTVVVSWTDTAGDAQSFLIERQTSGQQTFSSVGTAAASASSLTDSTATANTIFVYRVRALNQAGSSAAAVAAAVTTPAQ